MKKIYVFGLLITSVMFIGVKHWHGAAKDSWFAHVSVAVPAENAYTEWL